MLKGRIPGTGCLFEAIDSLGEAANIIRMFRIPEARRLFHIDCFGEMTMKECIINIQLSQSPTLHHSYSQKSAYSDRLNNRTKCFFVIQSGSLIEPFGHQSGFEPINRPISMSFHPKYPFTTNNITIRWRRHQLPGIMTH